MYVLVLVLVLVLVSLSPLHCYHNSCCVHFHLACSTLVITSTLGYLVLMPC